MSFRITAHNGTTPVSWIVSFLHLLAWMILVLSTAEALGANPKEELRELKEKLKVEEKKIEKTIAKEKSILTELENIEKSMKENKRKLTIFDSRLKKTQSDMKSLGRDIAELNNKLSGRRELLKKRLTALYKEQYAGDTALILISAENYQDLLVRSRYISMIAHYDRMLMNRYREELQNYHSQQETMEGLQQELETNKKSVIKSMSALREERENKDRLLASVKEKRSSYEQMVRELEDSAVKLKKFIVEMEKKKVPQSVLGKGFSSMQGSLPWPIDGTVLVPFGKYKDPKYDIPVFKNGIEIKTYAGADARAIHGGRVVYADWFKGFGQLLIINHDKGYHSLYGNLAEIFYNTGDIIEKGSKIGIVAETGLAGVPTLYFEIRYKGRPLDPLGWLLPKEMTTKRKAGTRVKRKIKKKLIK